MQDNASNLQKLVRFLGRVKFTMILLVLGAVAMTAGTIVESRHGRAAAWQHVYGTLWFDLFLLLIAVNLILSVVVRIPIQRHQWGFVLTHLAIVVLLAGAWVSRTFGYEGRLFVYEGQSQNRIFLDQREIRAGWDGGPAEGESFVVSGTDRGSSRVLTSESGDRPALRLLDYVPNAASSEMLAEAEPGEPPGVAILLTGGGINARDWLLADHPRHGHVSLGPWELQLVQGVLDEASAARHEARFVLAISPEGKMQLAHPGDAGIVIEDVELGRPAPMGTHDLALTVERLLPHARADVRVEPVPGEEGNAFVRVEASRGGQSRQAWLASGDEAHWTLGGKAVTVGFGNATRKLPFAVALQEFKIDFHPGSGRPKQYESRVVVKSPSLPGGERACVISMNRPLDMDGFRMFQSSYQLGENGGPDATILTVSRDPGAPLVYVSFVLIVIGIAWYLKRRMPDRGPLVAGNAAAALALLLTAAAATASAAGMPAPGAMPVESTRGWAILADGRVKPLQTFANETAQAVTGRESLAGYSSLELLWGFVLAPEDASTRPLIRVDSKEIKQALGLPEDQKRFSFEQLAGSVTLQRTVEQAQQREAADEKLSRLESDAQKVHDVLLRVHALQQGQALTIVPALHEDGSWSTPMELKPVSPAAVAVHDAFGALAAAYAAGDGAAFGRAADTLGKALPQVDPAAYPPPAVLSRELFNERLNAFGWAWKLYLAGFLVMLFMGFDERRRGGYWAGFALLAAGFVLHAGGIGLRWVIAERAPVSNMYESLAFMGAGAIAVGLVPEIIWRRRYFALAAGLVGFLTLVFAEHLPIDSAINPLVPVLAHTYWLSVHVMTIMLSYSALAVAMVMGHGVMFVELFQPKQTERLHSLAQALYKTLQVGLLFLAAGIACGAVWANESWGRYWGWDPKETWSLITFFVYLIIVHARFAGWLREFGLAASAIIGFMSVVMTYYGVNFILAAGLHSYGFADGGQYYAAAYVVVELVIIAVAWTRYRALGRTVRAH